MATALALVRQVLFNVARSGEWRVAIPIDPEILKALEKPEIRFDRDAGEILIRGTAPKLQEKLKPELV